MGVEGLGPEHEKLCGSRELDAGKNERLIKAWLLFVDKGVVCGRGRCYRGEGWKQISAAVWDDIE